CAFVSTNGGWNLAIGALTETGRFRSLKADDGCPIVTGQVQQDRCWAKVGLSKIAESPLHWLGLIPQKLAQTWNHESFQVGYLAETNPMDWTPQRKAAGAELLSGYHRLLLALAAFSPLGFVRWRESPRGVLVQGALILGVSVAVYAAFTNPWHPFWILAAGTPFLALLPLPGRPHLGGLLRSQLVLLFFASLTHSLFFGEDRYHIALSPMLCILAAGALRRTQKEEN
ncbi:MAG: hypothetical protein MK135_02765, partial [Polyangiaceae bacterium]|nr:hypothetical protein [Polyangiaceae bacterium]